MSEIGPDGEDIVDKGEERDPDDPIGGSAATGPSPGEEKWEAVKDKLMAGLEERGIKEEDLEYHITDAMDLEGKALFDLKHERDEARQSREKGWSSGSESEKRRLVEEFNKADEALKAKIEALKNDRREGMRPLAEFVEKKVEQDDKKYDVDASAMKGATSHKSLGEMSEGELLAELIAQLLALFGLAINTARLKGQKNENIKSFIEDLKEKPGVILGDTPAVSAPPELVPPVVPSTDADKTDIDDDAERPPEPVEKRKKERAASRMDSDSPSLRSLYDTIDTIEKSSLDYSDKKDWDSPSSRSLTPLYDLHRSRSMPDFSLSRTALRSSKFSESTSSSSSAKVDSSLSPSLFRRNKLGEYK